MQRIRDNSCDYTFARWPIIILIMGYVKFIQAPRIQLPDPSPVLRELTFRVHSMFKALRIPFGANDDKSPVSPPGNRTPSSTLFQLVSEQNSSINLTREISLVLVHLRRGACESLELVATRANPLPYFNVNNVENYDPRTAGCSIQRAHKRHGKIFSVSVRCVCAFVWE